MSLYIYILLVYLLQQERAVLLMDMFSSVDDKLLFGSVYLAKAAKTPKPSIYRLQTPCYKGEVGTQIALARLPWFSSPDCLNRSAGCTV